MKHLSRTLLFLALGCDLTAVSLAQQSLGDVARAARKKKPAEPTTKVITNEDLGSLPRLAAAPSDTTAKATEDAAAKTSDAAKPAADKDKTPPSADAQAKLDKQWQEKITAQSEKIALLERELDVLQRENRLRAASYYGDAGNRLRNERKYAEDDRKYRDDVAAKQKAIDDAKAEREKMKEEARKAGASPGSIG